MKKLLAGLLMIILLAGAVACGQAQQSESLGAPTVIPAPQSSGGKGFIVSSAPPPAITMTPSPVTQGDAAADSEESLITGRMIVRTGEMSLVVADVLDAMERITGLAGSYEGYVVSSNSWRDGDRLVGTIAIRVDADRYNDAVRALRELAVEVNSESTNSKDVTEEYTDLGARLRNLEAGEEQLIKLMERAGDVKEILEVQRELSQTRGEIEQTKARMQYLEQTSATSLINVRLEQAELDVTFTAVNRTVKVSQDIRFEPRIGGGISPYSYEWDFGDGNTSTDLSPIHAYKSEGSYTVTLKVTDDRSNEATEERTGYITVLPGWSAGNIAGSAWNGLATFGRALADIFIWLGIFSPVWIVVGGLIYLWRRKKKSKARGA